MQPKTTLRDFLRDPPPLPRRDEVEILVAQAMRLVPVSRLDIVERVSHGIRTPLSAILGFHEILEHEQGLAEQERQAFNNIIHTESRRLQRFIATLQTFDELRTGQFQVERTFDDLLATIERALRTFAADASAKNVAIRMPKSAFQVPLLADHRRLQFALEHLISNALRVSPRGSTIEVRSASTDADVRISVVDSGPGIPADELEKIFKPFNHFARPDDNGSELGLGLTIVRSIIELEGGTVEICDHSTLGTCFALSLPR